MTRAQQLALALVGLAFLAPHPSDAAATPLTLTMTVNTSLSFAASPTNGTAPLPVQFEAALVQDKTYTVDFGDGSRSAALSRSGCRAELCPTPDTPLVIARHTYMSAGTYSAVLSDADGARTTVTIVVASAR